MVKLQGYVLENCKNKNMARQIALKRELGLFHATAYGVGVILGAGIYVLIGEAASITGNTVWLAFLISAIVALLTGLSYAELSSLFPEDSAEYAYTKKSFGKMAAFFIGYLVFFSAIISSATVATGFAGYFSQLFDVHNIVMISIGVVVIFTILNLLSVKMSSLINILFTSLAIFGLFLIIFLGLFYLGDVSYIEMPSGLGGVFRASAFVFFAFLGFESIVKLSEEVKDPTKTIPRALILSIVISTVLYITVAIASVSILDWEVLAASKAPLADVAASVLGNKAFIMLSLIALFSTASTVLIALHAGSRTLYGISHEFKLLAPFRKVHKITRTPYYALIAVMFFSILFCLLDDIGIIAELTNFTLFVTFAAINLAIIVLRFKMPKIHRPFKVPFSIGRLPILPVFGVFSCIFFIFQLTSNIILGGLGLCLLGFVIYSLLMSFED
ncbi:amino acid permease [Patescibacteria group bacterium]|nr:amino acid permease [Patescibacteria group bacterium]